MQRVVLFIVFSFLFFSCRSQPDPKETDTSVQFKFKPLPKTEKEEYTAKIEEQYKNLLLQQRFNGEILVAKNGEVLLKDYHGIYNFETGALIDANSVFHLASISKTFTAAVILHLWEQGKISLDDDVRKYFPSFPYEDITVENLLSHKSGLPNYVYFMEPYTYATETIKRMGKKGRLVTTYRRVKVRGATSVEVKGLVTNQQMLQFIISQKPALVLKPNTAFNYCNTNYSILALIIEKITHTPFPQYMKDSVFTPLGLKHTFIFSIKDTAGYIPSYRDNRPYGIEKYDCIYGDKNVYSNIEDLFLWDKALYAGNFIKPSTYKMAIQLYSKAPRNGEYYGLGWHLLANDKGDIIPYHNGWWHGNNNVFVRVINSQATIIVLGNVYNRANYAAMRMSEIFAPGTPTNPDEENNTEEDPDSTDDNDTNGG